MLIVRADIGVWDSWRYKIYGMHDAKYQIGICVFGTGHSNIDKAMGAFDRTG
jgi:hypothetical protein